MQDIIGFFNKESSNTKIQMLKDVVKRVYQDKCLICTGMGHVAKDCGTKIDADKHFKLLNYGSEWGLIKSRVMSNNMSKFKAELSKRSRSHFAKDGGKGGDSGETKAQEKAQGNLRRTGPPLVNTRPNNQPVDFGK